MPGTRPGMTSSYKKIGGPEAADRGFGEAGN
jgi:hypothetical protein